MRDKKIAIIGCGNLGQSILQGLLADDSFDPKNIIVTRRNVSMLDEYKNTGIKIIADNAMAIRESQCIIVALKPYNILENLTELKANFDSSKHVLVSLASGVGSKDIHEALGIDLPIFRAMPNIAADVSQSLTCISGTIVIEEKLMEAATVLGACGIAFVLRFMRAMVQGGIQIGFSAEVAGQIVNQTVKGAAELIHQRGEHPEYEIDKVTTPKGCTIVGLNEMEHNGFSSALIKGIVASYDKI